MTPHSKAPTRCPMITSLFILLWGCFRLKLQRLLWILIIRLKCYRLLTIWYSSMIIKRRYLSFRKVFLWLRIRMRRWNMLKKSVAWFLSIVATRIRSMKREYKKLLPIPHLKKTPKTPSTRLKLQGIHLKYPIPNFPLKRPSITLSFKPISCHLYHKMA